MTDFKPRECYNNTGLPKMAFSSKKTAKAALRRMTFKTYKGQPMQRDAKIYKCNHCGRYHIGHGVK